MESRSPSAPREDGSRAPRRVVDHIAESAVIAQRHGNHVVERTSGFSAGILRSMERAVRNRECPAGFTQCASLFFYVHDDDVRLHSTIGGLSHRAVT
jgi:hypothetical protein